MNILLKFIALLFLIIPISYGYLTFRDYNPSDTKEITGTVLKTSCKYMGKFSGTDFKLEIIEKKSKKIETYYTVAYDCSWFTELNNKKGALVEITASKKNHIYTLKTENNVIISSSEKESLDLSGIIFSSLFLFLSLIFWMGLNEDGNSKLFNKLQGL